MVLWILSVLLQILFVGLKVNHDQLTHRSPKHLMVVRNVEPRGKHFISSGVFNNGAVSASVGDFPSFDVPFVRIKLILFEVFVSLMLSAHPQRQTSKQVQGLEMRPRLLSPKALLSAVLSKF